MVSSSFWPAQTLAQEPLHPTPEPILFPKLRIYFADFPYLLCSTNQRLLTLGTWCGYWYNQECKIKLRKWFFKDKWKSTMHPTRIGVLPTESPSSRQPVFRATRSKKEQITHSKSFTCITKIWLCYHPKPTPWSGNVNTMPYQGKCKAQSTKQAPPLGLTNPCPNAVHMEPFSTSIFKIFI